MKAISLHQPWTSAVAIGWKKHETRNRLTHVRGRIAIHAAKRRTFDQRCMWDDFGMFPELVAAFDEHQFHSSTLMDGWSSRFDQLPFGAIIATANLVDCLPTGTAKPKLSDIELVLGCYDPGRFAWKFENIQRLKEPIRFKGRQGWFEVPDSLFLSS